MLQTWGVAEVARWCGVRSTAVSSWRQRYGRWPVRPAVEINAGCRRYYGWTSDQREDWEKWSGKQAPERAAAMPSGPWQAGVRGGD